MNKIATEIDEVTTLRVDAARRIIYLYGVITSDTDLTVMAALMALGGYTGENPKPIRVIISSSGGDEEAGFSIFDTLRLSKAPIHTVGVGSVMSIAALVFQGGDKRFLSPECRMMVHAGTYEFGRGSIQQNHIMDYGREMRVVTRRYADLIAQRAGLKPGIVRNWCKGDKFFSAQEALDLGLADSILDLPKRKSK